MSADKAQSLYNEAQQFNALAECVQNDNLIEEERKALAEALETLYLRWYYRARLLLNGQTQNMFDAEYNGNVFTSRIDHFFRYGFKIYMRYNPKKKSSIIPKWTSSLERSFKTPLRKQRAMLLSVQAQRYQYGKS